MALIVKKDSCHEKHDLTVHIYNISASPSSTQLYSNNLILWSVSISKLHFAVEQSRIFRIPGVLKSVVCQFSQDNAVQD